MSGLQMAQDFAGLPDVAPARLTTSPKVNLFLPAYVFCRFHSSHSEAF